MTLIEIVIATALLSVVGTALTLTLIGSARGWGSGTAKDYTANNITLAMQKLSMEARDGSLASTSSTNDVLTVTYPSIMTDPTSSEKFYDTSTGSTITKRYYVSNGNLVRDSGSSVSIIGKGITSATFGSTGGRITVTLASREQCGTSTDTKQITSVIGLRNYRD